MEPIKLKSPLLVRLITSYTPRHDFELKRHDYNTCQMLSDILFALLVVILVTSVLSVVSYWIFFGAVFEVINAIIIGEFIFDEMYWFGPFSATAVIVAIILIAGLHKLSEDSESVMYKKKQEFLKSNTGRVLSSWKDRICKRVVIHE